MKRFIAGLGAGVALTALVLLVPFATSAAGPYVYGCTPGQSQGGSSHAVLYVYNGQTTTANIVAKAITPNGTNISASLGITSSFTVAPGNTKEIHWIEPTLVSGFSWDPPNDGTIVGAVRIVSDQPIAAGMNHDSGGDHFAECSYLHP